MAIIQFTPDADRQASNLGIRANRMMQDVVLRLAKWPEVSGAKPLKGNLRGNYRIRIGGEYRMLFRVVGNTVIIWKVGNRKDVYEE